MFVNKLEHVYFNKEFLEGQYLAKYNIKVLVSLNAKAFDIMYPKQVMTESCSFLCIKAFRGENLINGAKSLTPYSSIEMMIKSLLSDCHHTSYHCVT